MVNQASRNSSGGSSDRERRSLLLYALFRWESAAILAMTLILVVLVPDPFRGAVPLWQWWMWIVLGGLAEALIVLTTMSDPEARARIAGERLRAQFDLQTLADPDLRQQMARVLDLREQMEGMLQRTPKGELQAQLQLLAEDTSRWIGGLYGLAQRLSDVQDQTVLDKNLQSVPASIQSLEKQMARMAGAQDKAQLEQEIDQQRAWLEQLKQLDNLTKDAKDELAENQRALETVYTQMQLIAARGVDRRRVQHLRDEVTGHIQSCSELDREIAARLEKVAERA